MSDLAKWKLLGPVATLRTENATWDTDRRDWQPASDYTLTSFRPDGAISSADTHNPGGSIAHSRWLYDSSNRLTESDSWMNDKAFHRVVYFYDEAGRHIRTAGLRDDGTLADSEICTYDTAGKMTKVVFLHFADEGDRPPGLGARSIGYSIEGMDMAFSAPGASLTTTTYDKEHLPARVIFQDANHNPLQEVLFERDAAGRLHSLEIRLCGESPFKEILDDGSPERRRAMAAFLQQTFGQSFSRTTYRYDPQGRLLERTDNMGTLKNDRTTYRYDDVHDEPLEETTEDSSREANLDDEGNVQYEPDTVNVQHNRFEYKYDTQGNWTERIVSIRPEPDPDFQRSNIERREITYHRANPGALP